MGEHKRDLVFAGMVSARKPERKGLSKNPADNNSASYMSLFGIFSQTLDSRQLWFERNMISNVFYFEAERQQLSKRCLDLLKHPKDSKTVNHFKTFRSLSNIHLLIYN